VFGVNGGEFLVLGLLALIVIGPERLPHYAAELARFVRQARTFATGAQEQVRAELGPDFDDVDWRKLDPRQYDPRRIVRQALTEVWEEDEPLKPQSRPAPRPASGPGSRPRRGARPARAEGTPPPFDAEAT
jgi:sec-independent protein translocase protein TatB